MMKDTDKKNSEPEISLSSSIVAANDDLLTEILLRLPIKPLFRFKTVSKHWLYLIANPRFSHRKSLDLCKKNTSGLFIVSVKSEYEVIHLDCNTQGTTTPPHRTLTKCADLSLRILQSCNGLMCRCSGVENGKYDYFIYNPTTNQFKRLPHPTHRVLEIKYGKKSVSAVNIAFDPRNSPYYKVICIYPSKTVNCDYDQMEIYSSETGVWRSTNNPFRAKTRFFYRYGVYWNGSVHWIDLWKYEGLYFHVEEERFGTMPMPPVPDGPEERRIIYFGESNDCLHIIEIQGLHTTQFNVYEMDKGYKRWSMIYRVDVESVMNAFPPTIFGYRDPYDSFLIVTFVRAMSEEESFLVLSVPGKAIRYNIRDKTFRKISDIAPREWDFELDPMVGWDEAFQYIESISSV